ncbi:FecR family protein [Daejeonella sp.]|uniref:FecR family protein n=1 Tax=Daejeonella sp. TaxID=2805397 RepID=UPI00271EF294|nr:FecR family protein [Daejeonella sp.]MDO8994716.1 FecR domain-containing protein [Daejeonella sp.]MDP2415127.1 FecR domain-containing protein [Daejeonella sp.]
MSIHRFRYLFQQFIKKTASSDEIEEFLAMMKREDFDDEVKILLDEFWNQVASDAPIPEEKAERIFNSIMASSREKESFLKLKSKSFWYRSAAAIFIIGLSAMFYLSRSGISESQQVKVILEKPKIVEKPTRRFINLPDGSSVILNENSQIEIAENFNSDAKREVYLMGEAYFDINHDSERPFIVHTGKLKTTVLGTAFNIKSSAGAKTVTVTVTRGKVEVGDENQTFNVITPNEQIVFNEEHNNVVKTPVKAESYIKWTNEDIYFDDVSIKDVAKQLQERFGVSIVFSNEQIKTCKFSATFLKSQSLPQILNIIAEFNQIKYQFRDNKVVVLDGSGCE